MYSCTAPRPARDGIPHPSCVPLTGISDSVFSLPWLWSDEDFQKSAKRPMFRFDVFQSFIRFDIFQLFIGKN